MSLKPADMKCASELVRVEAPNLDVLKMKEKMSVSVSELGRRKEEEEKARLKAQGAKLQHWLDGKKKKQKGKFDESDSDEEQ